MLCLFCLGVAPVVAQDPVYCELSEAPEFLKMAQRRSQQAETASDLRVKSQKALEGIYFANKCLALETQNVGCLYYRAVNRGLDLETRTLKIKNDLLKMIAEFNQVIALDPTYDEGGAYLALGQVYLKLPGLSVLGAGLKRDLGLALDYAQKAVVIEPRSPENHKLVGLVAYKSKNYELALKAFKQALKAVKGINKQDQARLALRDSLKKWVSKTRKKIKRARSKA